MIISQSMETLLTHIQLQATVYQVEETVILDYAWLNFQRNMGRISKQDYYEMLWEITSEVATTEEVWERYIDFFKLVTELTNEYYMEHWFEFDNFMTLLDFKD
ncbi:MAG: hypothetical protein AAGF26_08040 [Cyanobacteria bacterium P01_G01_bin.49]